MDDENENLVGIDDVYSDDFQTQILVSDLSVLVETLSGWATGMWSPPAWMSAPSQRAALVILT